MPLDRLIQTNGEGWGDSFFRYNVGVINRVEVPERFDWIPQYSRSRMIHDQAFDEN